MGFPISKFRSHRALVLFFGFGLATLLASPANAANNWVNEAFAVKTHNFGTVGVASKTEFRFEIFNPLDQPIHLSKVRRSCGCTTPIIETPWIQPGETGSILARFNTDTFRGKKGATLTVVIDRPTYTEVRLRVDGYIRSDMVFHPGEVHFGTVDQGDTKSSQTKVLYAGRSDWQIRNIESNVDWLQPEVKLSKRGGGQIHYDIIVNILEHAPEGDFLNQLTLVTNDTRQPRVPLRVSGSVAPPIQIAPRNISIANIKVGDVISKRLVLKGKQSFQLRDIQCEGWEISFEPTEDPKNVHIVNAQFKAIAPQPRKQITVNVQTDDNQSQSGYATVLTTFAADE